jgi:hypothetical protein
MASAISGMKQYHNMTGVSGRQKTTRRQRANPNLNQIFYVITK